MSAGPSTLKACAGSGVLTMVLIWKWQLAWISCVRRGGRARYNPRFSMRVGKEISFRRKARVDFLNIPACANKVWRWRRRHIPPPLSSIFRYRTRLLPVSPPRTRPQLLQPSDADTHSSSGRRAQGRERRGFWVTHAAVVSRCMAVD